MTRTLLIVADPGDRATAEVARAAAASAPALLTRLVTTADLTLARWSHRIDATAGTATVLTLRDGTRLDSLGQLSVAYLASTMPVPAFTRSTPADRDYAAAEFRALIVSWLRSLGDRALNAPSGTEPNGPAWSPGKWLVEAAASGLPVTSASYATSARLVPGWRGPPGAHRLPVFPDGGVGPTVLVTGEHVVGPLRDGFSPACWELSKRSGCPVIYLRLAPDPDGLVVVSAGPFGSPSTPDQVLMLAQFIIDWAQNR